MNIQQPLDEEATSQEAYDPNEVIEITDGTEPPAPKPVSNIPVEETNVAEALTPEELKQIAEKVIKDYETDLQSREQYDLKTANYLKLFYQDDKASNPPWDGSSDESIPILTEAVNQFQSRTYKAFFPNRNFVAALPVGQSNSDVRERAERVAAHINWQLSVLDRDYKKNKNQMFMACALHGNDFTKTYFDHIKRRTIIERVREQDLIVPYHLGPLSIENLPRKTHRQWKSVNDTRIMAKMGFYLSPAVPYTEEEDIGQPQQAVDEQQGLEETNIYQESERPALILEQHCLLDLDEDGIAEPYIVWVDKQGRDVKRIQIRYEVDKSGIPTKGKEPVELFTHYKFLPNPDGFLGFGFGFLLAKINFALNKLVRMFIDAGELSTVGNLTYLVSESLGIPGGEIELELGKGIKIPRSVDDIRKHFTKMEFRGPDPSIQVTIEYLQGVAQRIASSSDIMAGQPDKVYQPQALLAMLEQGLQLYSSVQEFMAVSMEDELQKVYRLNAKYLTTQEYFFQGDKQLSVMPADYQDDFRIVPIFDPKYSTRSQKLAKAQAEVEFITQFPLTAQNPQSLYLAGRTYLQALDVEDIDEILPPPQIPQPVRVDDQNLENAYFIAPPDKRPLFDVFPDQDHTKHIQTIDKFISSFLDQGEAMEVPLASQEDVSREKELLATGKTTQGDPGIQQLVSRMSKEQKEELIANLLRHRAMHLSFLYGQINHVMDQNGQPVGQGAFGQLAQPSGNQGGMEGLMQLLQSAAGSQDMRDGQGSVPPGAG